MNIRKKRIFCSAIALMMVVALAVPAFAAEKEKTNILYLGDASEKVKVVYFDYDSEDVDTLLHVGYSLANAQPTSSISPYRPICCDPSTMRLKDMNYTLHQPVSPLPSNCYITNGVMVYCTGCNAVWSTTVTGRSSHYHEIGADL